MGKKKRRVSFAALPAGIAHSHVQLLPICGDAIPPDEVLDISFLDGLASEMPTVIGDSKSLATPQNIRSKQAMWSIGYQATDVDENLRHCSKAFLIK